MSLRSRLIYLGRVLVYLFTGRWRAPSPLPAPVIPAFHRGTSMTLNFSALAALPDPSFRYVLTVTPQGAPPVAQTLTGGMASTFAGLPAGPGVISLVAQDGKGDPLSPVATEPYALLAAPAIPAFTVAEDAPAS